MEISPARDTDNYNPDLKLFLCPCGSQKRNSNRLCRHLIRKLAAVYGGTNIKHLIYGCQRREILPFIFNPFSERKVRCINGLDVPVFKNSFPMSALYTREEAYPNISSDEYDEFFSDDETEQAFENVREYNPGYMTDYDS